MRHPIAALAMLVLTLLAPGHAVRAEDDLLWLETPHDVRALDWARAATQRTREQLGALPSSATVVAELAAVLAQAPAEPDQYLMGERAVRFLRDAAHPYGLLQTAPRDADGLPSSWSTVLDIAELRRQEGVPFELDTYGFGGSCLPPAYARCLLRLSPGGGDEVEIREFDLAGGRFVEDGFRVAKSRAAAEWMGPDAVLVGHTLGDAARTLVGWPATFGLWTRGQPLDAARRLFDGESTDMILQLAAIGTGAARQGVITRAIDYSTFEISLVDAAGATRTLALPASLKLFGVLGTTSRHVLVQLARDAVVEGTSYKAETLLAYDTDPATPEGGRVSPLYVPAEGEAVDALIGGLTGMRDNAVIVVNRNLRQRVVAASFADGGWTHREILEAAPGETITLRAGEPERNAFIATVTGFLTPRAQYLVQLDGRRRLLAQDPQLLDADGFTVDVGSAISRDGTSIDYLLLRPRKPASGPQPLLMTGYGAFGMSARPGYFDAGVGGPALKLWLDRGGALAVPAIRGGGERGSAWHEAAIREKRQNSYDDFIAVTEHLIGTGFAAPAGIGIFGMSNGGLLTAVLGTQRPDLYSAVVSDVPLTDLIRMRDMGMGAAWMNEYGNPDDPQQARAMLAYSPYQNVRPGTHYPPFLVTISTEDNRVGSGHARKFAHRLQDVGASVHFYEAEEGGHGVSDALRNPELMALRMSFLIDTLMARPH